MNNPYQPEPRKWEQKEWLYKKYWGELLTQREIADLVDVHRTTIRKQMQEFGIPVRSVGWRVEDEGSPVSGFYRDKPAPNDRVDSNYSVDNYNPDYWDEYDE